MARSIWTGSLSFGLVNIPVRVFSAIREHDVRFHQLAPDGSRIHYKRVSEKSGREVEFANIKKGYETSKGKYVVFEATSSRSWRRRRPRRSTSKTSSRSKTSIRSISTVPITSRPAGERATEGVRSRSPVMEDRQRVGIGKVVMREKQYLAAIRPYGKGLAMSTMLFADEIVPQSTVDGIPERKPTVAPRRKPGAVQDRAHAIQEKVGIVAEGQHPTPRGSFTSS